MFTSVFTQNFGLGVSVIVQQDLKFPMKGTIGIHVVVLPFLPLHKIPIWTLSEGGWGINIEPVKDASCVLTRASGQGRAILVKANPEPTISHWKQFNF